MMQNELDKFINKMKTYDEEDCQLKLAIVSNKRYYGIVA